MTKSYCRNNASALVITLAFLVLITVLTVALMDTVRIERVSANSHLEGLRAEYFAQSGVDRVVAALRMQTATSGTNQPKYWISQPGQLLVADAASNGVPNQPVDLSSGAADPALTDPALRPPDLNVPTFRDPASHLITEHTDSTGRILQMAVAWIYVRQSGALVTDPNPDTTTPAAKADPIVGRYAYWTDGESSKINYNLAWGRSGNSAVPGDPSNVNLTALRPLENGKDFQSSSIQITQPMADELHQFISGTTTGAHFFNTPEDARQVPDAGLVNAIKQYKFELTHYNSDPDITFFNEPRIVLTTQLSKVPQISGSARLPFLNILKGDNLDPGILANIDDKKLSTVLNSLMSPPSGNDPGGYLTRKDWPMAFNSSFQKKYYANNASRLAQLAINIIDYVRCRESKEPVVQPMRGTINMGPPVTWKMEASYDANGYIGVTRAPCITELGVSGSGGNVVVKVELYSPESYHLPDIDLVQGQYTLFLQINCDAAHGLETTINSTELSQTTLKHGTYTTITHTYGGSVALSGTASVRVALSLPNKKRVDIVPLVDGGASGNIQVPVNGASMEANDPRVNKVAGDWKPCPDGTDTFGRRNARYLLDDVVNTGPQQDTNANGTLTAASLYMPPQKGSSGNLDGVVTSIGELGFIHTGVQSSGASGTPWRTLRLQPSSNSVNTVPDWALMDLFTVPITVPVKAKPIFQPNGNSFGGRVNINSLAHPFTVERILPLAAVFQGSPYKSTNLSDTLSSGSAQTIAQNILNFVFATGTNNGKNYGLPNAYYSPGEICEIWGVSDGGEESEELIRRVANLITARGNVFTVYAVGESIKQTPSGKLLSTGHRRLQAMIERYVDSATDEVQFRTVYFRNLTP